MARAELFTDCGACAALCCIALPFDASEDFAFDKAAGARCRYLRADCRCAVHAELVPRGLSGCAVFECHGAGPRVTRAYAGRMETPALVAERDEAFRVLREVHELLWQLTEAAKLCAALPAARGGALEAELRGVLAPLDEVATLPVASLLAADLRPHRAAARGWLRRLGEALGGRRAAAARLVVLR